MAINYEKELGTVELNETTDNASPYVIDKELAKKGYEYDLNAIYIPLTVKSDLKNIYLKISRNKDKKSELGYSWVSKNEDDKKKYNYKELGSFTREKTIIAEDTEATGKKSIVGKLVATGSLAKIDLTTDEAKTFITETITTIATSEKLDILKENTYAFSSDYESEVAKEINNRIKPKLTDEQKQEALEVEKQIRENEFVQYMKDILKKVHIGDNKSIMRALLGEFAIINGWSSFMIMSNGGAEAGKSFEAEISLDFIPKQYIFKVNDMTKSYFSRKSEVHEKYYDRLLCVFGDLGSKKAFAEMEDVFNIMKILITENEYARGLSDKEDGKYEPTDYKLSVDSIGAVFQTTAFDFLDIEGEQLASRTIKVTPADADKKKVLKHIFEQIGFDEDAKTNKRIAEATTEMKKFQSYILYLVSKDIQIINPWYTVFERFVDISNTPYRDMKQILYLFKAYCTMTYFECDKIGDNKLLASKKQLETFLNDISLNDALPPLESSFLKMLIGKGTNNELTIIKTADEDNSNSDDDASFNQLNIYFNNVIESFYSTINGERQGADLSDMGIDSISSNGINEVIATLLHWYRLKGRGSKHIENVFFTVSDVKYAYANKKAYKNVNDISKMLNKLYKLGFIDKIEYRDNKGQNIYYLTSKCENIIDAIAVTESDEVEARKLLKSEMGVNI